MISIVCNLYCTLSAYNFRSTLFGVGTDIPSLQHVSYIKSHW